MNKNLLQLFLSLFLLLCSFASFAQLPFSPCSPTGGARADLLDVQTKFRNTGGAAQTFTIPVGATSAVVYISSHNRNAVTTSAQTDEDFISVNAVLNFKTGTSSGILNYSQSTNTDGSGTNLYSWKNVALGSNVTTGTLVGDASPSSPYLNSVNFSKSGNILTITETNTSIKSSYYVEFSSADVSSLNLISFATEDAFRGVASVNRDLSIPIPANTKIILISGKGTNGVSDNTSFGGTEEGYSNLRFSIDVDKALLDGFITVANGGANNRRSTYIINNQNALTATNLTASAGVSGDFMSKSTSAGGVGLYNPQIYISGNNLIIKRDANYARDFDDAYIFEFYSRVNQPIRAEFIDSDAQYIAKGDGSTTGTSRTFKIPAGSTYIYFNQSGNAINSDNEDNENSLAAYAIINLKTEQASGYFYQQVGFNQVPPLPALQVPSTIRRDDNYTFNNLPLTNASSRDNRSGGLISTSVYDLSFSLSADKSEITITNKAGLVANQYQYVLSCDFFGSRPDLAFNIANISFAKGANCKEVKINARISNPGAGDNPGAIPVSFYDGDPTVNPNAKRLLTDVITFNQAIASQTEKDFVFTLDLSNYSNLNIPITMILNDDGTFAPTLNAAIGSPFNIESLRNQSDKRIECFYDNNKFSNTINVNNCPTPNLDPDNSSNATGVNNYKDFFTVGSSGVKIADSDLIIVDPENSNLQSAIITLTNRPDGDANESLFIDGILPGGLTANYVAATGVLTISGNASQADYIAAIKLVKYRTLNPTPNQTTRNITTVLNDGVESGPASNTSIEILVNPQINITGNNITIPDGTTTTQLPNGTNFGNISTAGGVVSQIFEIQNVGTDTLGLTNSPTVVTISGTDFTITAQPLSNSLNSTVKTPFTVSFDPALKASGIYSATVTVTSDDPFAARQAYTFNVSVAINDVPVVADISKSGPEDQVITFTATDFTNQFTDADGTLQEITVIDLPLNGTLKLGLANILPGQKIPVAQLSNITFTPSANFNRNTSFNWNGTDGTVYATTPAKVNINITPVNDPPVVSNITKTGSKNNTIPFTDLNFINRFSDIDGDALTKIQILTLPAPAEGVLQLNGNPVSANDEINVADLANITFVPNLNYSGSSTFTWNGFDGNTYASSPASVNITITDANTRHSVGAISKTGPQNVVVPFAAANFTDKFYDLDNTLASITVTNLANFAGNGTLLLSGTPVVEGNVIPLVQLGNLTFMPALNYTGTTSFNWDGSDGTALSGTTALVNITITPNNPPVVSNISKSGLEDQTIPFSIADFTSKFSDADGNSLTTVRIVNLPANGKLFLNGVELLSSTDVAIADIPLLTFVPDANWNGTTTFKWNGFDGTGYAVTAADVNITVTAVNDAPVFSTVAYSIGTCEATAEAGTITAATDVDGDVPSYSVTTNPTKGGVTISSITGAYTYTPTAGQNGADSFIITASDGNGGTTIATVNVTITAPPVSGALSGTQGICVAGTTTFASTVTGGTWTTSDALVATVNASTGAITGVASGTATITYTVSGSGGCADATATRTVTVTTAQVSGTLSGTQGICVAGTTTFASTVTGGTWTTSDALVATVNASTGAITGVASGTATITYTVSGSGGCADATATRTVTVNTKPSVTPDAPTVAEDGTVNGAVTATDLDADALNFTVSENPSNGSLTLNTNGTYTYVPNSNYNGNDSFDISVSDGNCGIVTVTVPLIVTPVNDPPVATPDAPTTPEDTPVNGTVTATDVDGDPLTFTKATNPANGIVTVNTDGTYTYTPNPNFNGNDSFTVTVSDGKGGTNTVTVPLIVTPVNDPPVATPDAPTTPEDTPVNGTVTATDVDGDPLTFTKATNPANGIVTVNTDGTYTYTPNPNFNGNDSFTVMVSDGKGGTNTVTVTVIVTPVNDPPVAMAPPITTPENTPKNGTVTGTDVDGDPLTFTKASNPTNGTVTVNPNGTYTYTPNTNFNGNDSFTVTVTDGKGGSTTITVNVTVTANPVIGIAKQVSAPKLLLNGYYEFTYTFKVANMGSSLLNNVQVRDDLSNAFSGVENLMVTKLEATNGLIVNPTFNGSSDKNLLAPNNKIAINTEATVTLTIRVLPGTKFGTFENSATATAISATGNIPTSDVSTAGERVDLNGNGKPDDNGEDRPTVVTLSPTEIIVPEGFSPNGDSVNDQLIIENTGNKRIDLEIYNRWGNVVYKNPDYKNDWDGRANRGVKVGSDVPDGTYYYIIIVEGQKLPIKFFTINR